MSNVNFLDSSSKQNQTESSPKATLQTPHPIALPTPTPISTTGSSAAQWSFTNLKKDFQIAIENRDLSALDAVLKAGFQPTPKDCSTLMCIMQGNEDFALQLIDILPLQVLNTRDELRRSFLFHAVHFNQKVVVDALIKKGFKLNEESLKGQVLLLLAVDSGSDDLAIALIEELPSEILNAINVDGNPFLHYIIGLGKERIAKALIKKGIDIYVKNNSERTPLDYALGLSREEIAIDLIENLSIEELNRSIEMGSYLHVAAFKALPNVAIALLKRGINMRVKDRQGHTAFERAIMGGRHQIVEAIVERLSENVALNSPNRSSIIELHAAILSNDEKTIQKLIEDLSPNDLRYRNFAGNTPLLSLILNKNEGCALRLASKLKSTPHALRDRDADQRLIPLHVAISQGLEGLTTHLRVCLKSEELLKDRDSNGATALHRTVLSKKPWIAVPLAKKCPLSLTAKDKFGMTPLDWATHYFNEKTVQELLEISQGIDSDSRQ